MVSHLLIHEDVQIIDATSSSYGSIFCVADRGAKCMADSHIFVVLPDIGDSRRENPRHKQTSYIPERDRMNNDISIVLNLFEAHTYIYR